MKMSKCQAYKLMKLFLKLISSAHERERTALKRWEATRGQKLAIIQRNVEKKVQRKCRK